MSLQKRITTKHKKLVLSLIIIASLTGPLLLATTTQHQNKYPLINAYLQGVTQSPNSIIREKTTYIDHDYTFTGNIHDEIVMNASNIVINGDGYLLAIDSQNLFSFVGLIILAFFHIFPKISRFQQSNPEKGFGKS
ncbi:MAG: hypothetical protein KIH10_04530 [Candidatus Freyarchaeota archaeon]|nr:hypothetical protein [Candidatus Jordarchaeia archaeon]